MLLTIRFNWKHFKSTIEVQKKLRYSIKIIIQTLLFVFGYFLATLLGLKGEGTCSFINLWRKFLWYNFSFVHCFMKWWNPLQALMYGSTSYQGEETSDDLFISLFLLKWKSSSWFFTSLRRVFPHYIWCYFGWIFLYYYYYFLLGCYYCWNVVIIVEDFFNLWVNTL